MLGPGITMIDCGAKIAAYYKKLILWQTHMKRDKESIKTFDMSSESKNILSEKERMSKTP